MNSPYTIQRLLPITLALLILLTLNSPAAAQQCNPLLQDKRFTLVVPYGPGGGFDAYARLFAAQFQDTTGSVMRIRNLPGAGAMIGITAVAEAGPSDLVLGLFNPVLLLNDRIVGRDSPDMDSLVLLGSLYTDVTAWARRRDKDVRFDSAEPRLFAMASNSDFIRILLPGYVLGWNINLVRGYSGSTEAMLALLRGDVDFFYSSSLSLASQLQSMEELTAFLSLTEGPNPIFPEAPYLAGVGGVVEQLSSGQDPEQQRQRQELARLVVELATTHRALSITSKADTALVDCLLTAVQTTLENESLHAAAARQNLVITAKSGAELQAEIATTEALIERNLELLQQLAARSP